MPEISPGRDKNFSFFVSLVLFGFGTYLSVLYYGYQKVPPRDFYYFVITGRQLLSFDLPTSFTRLPVPGILISGLSHFLGGACPELSAGWLLNAFLNPFNLLLLGWSAERSSVIPRSGWQ